MGLQIGIYENCEGLSMVALGLFLRKVLSNERLYLIVRLFGFRICCPTIHFAIGPSCICHLHRSGGVWVVLLIVLLLLLLLFYWR